MDTSLIKFGDWHAKSASEVVADLDSVEKGLNEREVKERLLKFGFNKLPEAKADGFLKIFLRQFQSPLIYVLFGAAVIVFFEGDVSDSLIILSILIFNAIVGTLQEGKAQNTFLALKKFVETKAVVLREGEELIIPDYEIVPGDVILLQEGEKVPADARIIYSNNFNVDESALTGESVPVYKTHEQVFEKDTPVADQKNMVFKGSNVSSGNARVMVVATGSNTEIGKISGKLSAISEDIPLKKEIKNLSKIIILVVLAISLFLFTYGILTGKTAKEMFLTVVSLSVSIIPEGLPIVITLVLATGVWRMSKKNALVKKLQAVEALGQANVIAVDKTGTITKNEMIVGKIFSGGKYFDVGGNGYDPKGEFFLDGNPVNVLDHKELEILGRMAAICSNARIVFLEEEKKWQVYGDPTEAAMSVLGEKAGFKKDLFGEETEVLEEIPFDYKNKYHAVKFKHKKEYFFGICGAPESILALSDKTWFSNKSEKMTKEKLKQLEEIFITFSSQGFRVIALAFKKESKSTELMSENIKGLNFAGFLAIKDTLRSDAVEAVRQAKEAGIKVVMITGDYFITARSIAKEAGIFKEGDDILSGIEIDAMSDDELASKMKNVAVFSRVTPEHKFRIINIYKKAGDIIAMTGDGVNDAPSLMAADLGISMGRIGTEVAKEAGDIVLLDDNFASIVAAIEEGRSIFKTIKKVMLYLFSTSIGEVLAIMGALFLGYPLPILPSQIIWLNFVTDGFLDISLAMEPKEDNLLGDGFKKPKKYIIDKLMALRIFIMGPVMMIGTLFVFSQYFETDLKKAWTMSLTVLAAYQWFNAWNCRHESVSIFKMKIFSNKFLVLATLIVVALQMLAIYNPVMQKILHTVPLSLNEWLLVVPVAFTIIIAEEIRKFIYRRKKI